MRWDDERYVRIFTRDTADLLDMGWEARALLWELVRKADRAGIVQVGKSGVRGLARLTGIPEAVVVAALPVLLEDGCLELLPGGGGYVLPNYIAAQETPQSDAARKRASRERAAAGLPGGDAATRERRSRAGNSSQDVTSASRPVTSGHSVPCCADPIRTDPLLRAPARVESPPEAAPPPEPERPPELTLGETFAAEEAKPIGELDALARELAAEGNSFGRRCVGYLDGGQALPAAMREKLREILAERAKPRPPAPRRALTVTAEEQALVAVYVAAQKRIRREDVPQLELHALAARRILPDLATLAKSIAADGWAPTPADVLAHKLETYLRMQDQRLFAEGYPLGLVLVRTDATDLPRPPKRAKPAAQRDGPAPPREPRPMIRYAGRNYDDEQPKTATGS